MKVSIERHDDAPVNLCVLKDRNVRGGSVEDLRHMSSINAHRLSVTCLVAHSTLKVGVELNGDGAKAIVARPKFRAVGERNGSEYVDIGKPDSLSHEPVMFDEVQRFGVCRDDARRQCG